ncbi:MAG: hypothetical protein HYY49_04630 [Ignavibacteriales bacterium]|nr:hypothetical protein [Ignavibacteriales bacterium]
MNEKNSYVVGLDGGGTKTAAILADLSGTVITEATGGPSNFQMIGVERAAEVLWGLIDECCRKAQVRHDELGSVVAGLTGAGRPSDKERMKEGFRAVTRQSGITFDSIVIESDARIALEGAFRAKLGIILIAGTGSIAFAKDSKGDIHRVGGWGRTLGDEGSGYAIGREGLNAVTKDLDGRGKHTTLTKLVEKQFGFSNQESIITAVYRENFDIASVAPLVLEAASGRDSVCLSIVDKAAKDLCEHVRVMVSLVNSSGIKKAAKIPLALIGTLAGGENFLSRALRRRISATLKRIKVIPPESSAAYGAILMALTAIRGKE